MKKIVLPVLFCISAALVLASCAAKEKDYTCQCLDKKTKVGTNSFGVKAETLSDADAQCQKLSSSTEDCKVSY